MIGNNIEYIQAYTEINCLLKYFPKHYLEKLPDKLLKFIDENSNKQFEIEINYNNNLKQQNLSKKTYDILSVLKYNYWSTEEEKEHIKKKLIENEKLFQKELTKKYSADNLFNSEKMKTDNIKEETKAVVEYREKNIIQKIMDKIKMIFNRN